jgi:integrase/recombinase XerD
MNLEKKKTGRSTASMYSLTEEEIHRMISAASNRRDRLIIELLAFTGCRRGELVLLRRCDINLKRGVIQMPTIKQRHGDPYSNSRIVPIINDKLRFDLEAYLELTEIKYRPSGLNKLIQSDQRRTKDGIDEVRINQIVTTIADQAGVKSPNPNRKHVHPHMFRHNFVRYARKCNLNFKVISLMIGHASVATTIDIYGVPDEEEIIADAKKMEGYGKL